MPPSPHDPRARNSHYPPGTRNPEHHDLYSGLASWRTPHNDPQPSGPSSGLIPSPGSSTLRQLPASYYHYSSPTEYVNQQQAVQPYVRWHFTPTCYRPGWSQIVNDENPSSRSARQYGDATPSLTAPQPEVNATHQHASTHRHTARHAQSQEAFRITQQQQEFRFENAFSAPSTAQPFQSTLPSAPVTRLLNYPLPTTAPLHISSQPLASSTPVSWPSVPGSSVIVEPSEHGYPITHTNDTFPSGVLAPSPGALSGSSWVDLNGTGSASVTPVFERSGSESEWTTIRVPAGNVARPHLIPQLTPTSPIRPPQPPPVVRREPAQNNRRAASRQKPITVPSSFIKRGEKSKVSKRHGPLSRPLREKASTMRKGAKRVCVRCRFYKAGCDGNDPCQKCDIVRGKQRIYYEPCCRSHIEDTSLVRRCNGRFNQTEADFLRYPWKPGGNIHVMDIVWNLPGFGPVSTNQPLRIQFREYQPEGILNSAQSENSTQSNWQTTDGQLVHIEQPPYAVYDTATLQDDVEAYFIYNLRSIDQWLLDRNRYDEIAMFTYREALRLRDMGSELLNLALQLQFLSIVSQGYGTIRSTSVIGIKDYNFDAVGRCGYEAYDRKSWDRPLPGAVNHQMDVAFIKFLKRLEGRCIKKLASVIFKEKVKPWYELFLTLFVIFRNLEYIHGGAESYIKSKNGTSIADQVSNVVSQQIVKWDFSFEVLMQHWRISIRDFRPFALARENPQELHAKGHLPDARAFDYMTTMVNILARKGPERFARPYTGLASATSSLDSKWISELFNAAGG